MPNRCGGVSAWPRHPIPGFVHDDHAHRFMIRPEWLAATVEPALDPAQPVVDAHHHLYDRPGTRYLLQDYLADIQPGTRYPGFGRRTGPSHAAR